MRNFAANQTTVYFKKYIGNTEAVDENGLLTGSHTIQYGPLKCVKMCVSASSGSSAVRYSTELRTIEDYGSFTAYDRLLSTTNIDLDINEQSIIWLDGASTSGNHNYMVTKKSVWKNSLLIAVREVKVTDN